MLLQSPPFAVRLDPFPLSVLWVLRLPLPFGKGPPEFQLSRRLVDLGLFAVSVSFSVVDVGASVYEAICESS